MKFIPTHSAQDRSDYTVGGVLALLAVALALIAFSGALLELVNRWSRQEEYSHGFLIPIIAIWMLWARRDAVMGSIGRPSWIGPVLILLAMIMLLVGELSALYLLAQLGFIMTLIGIALGFGGFSLLRVVFVPIAFLLFAIPMPYLIDSQLSWRLQLLSSELGVFFIRLFRIPVFLSGNVIDLGSYKLQVADACSGLRYLYPLLSFGFLAAYLFQAPFWQRALVFFSAIPITIVMNSLRIGMIGVLVDRWGIAMAEGALHFFEGWVIFLACAALMGAEIYLLARIGSGKGFFDVFYFPKVLAVVPRASHVGPRLPLLGCLLLCAAGLTVFLVSGREELIPDRVRFLTFPRELGPWQGRPSLMEPQVEHSLGLDDYILADYINRDQNFAVNLYVAYYASQRKGSSPHSPIVCIPGGGWHITNFERTNYRIDGTNTVMPFNRVVVAYGSDRQIVYYWFVQRGRKLANEYWSKWYLFADAITMNRTDGALVRLTTPVYRGEADEVADKRLQTFIKELEPRLSAYLPRGKTNDVKSAQHRTKDNPVMGLIR